MSRRKTTSLGSQQFYKFEKWILAEKKIKNLSPIAKLLYMVIRDREEISLKNAKDFTDKDGCLFQYFDQVKASELLGVSLSPIKKAFKDLQEYKLIESVRQGQGKPNRIYVLEYEISNDTLEELSYEKEKVPTCEVEDVNKNSTCTNSICNNNTNNTSKEEKNKDVKTVKAIDVLNENGILIAKKDIEEINNTCTDLDKLKKAIDVLKAKGSFGIIATINAYNSIEDSSSTGLNGSKIKVHDNFSKNNNPNVVRNDVGSTVDGVDTRNMSIEEMDELIERKFNI